MLVPDDVRVIFQDTTFTDMRSLTDDVVGGLVGTLTRRNRAGHDLLDTETGAPIGNRLVYMLTPEDIEDHQFVCLYKVFLEPAYFYYYFSSFSKKYVYYRLFQQSS